MASIASYADTAWNAAGTSFTTSSSITWSAGDLVLAICGIEDAGATINTPTFSGGTFTQVDANTAASTCNAKSFQCTPASGGSGTVNFTTSVSKQGGISVWVITGTSGLGDHKEQHTTTKTVASTRQGTTASIYVWCALDFAGDGVGAGSPTPSNTRKNVAANSDFLLCDLTNVTTNQSYGQDSTGGTTGPFTLLVMEAKDAGVSPSPPAFTPLNPMLRKMGPVRSPWLPHYFPPASAQVDATINHIIGQLTLTGDTSPPKLDMPPSIGALTLTQAGAQVPVVTAPPTVGTLTLTANTHSPQLTFPPSIGTLTLTANTHSPQESLLPSVGVLNLTSNAHSPAVSMAQTIGTLLLTADAPGVSVGGNVTVNHVIGTLTLTADTNAPQDTMSPSIGSLSLVGNTQVIAESVTPTIGTLTITADSPQIQEQFGPPIGTIILAGDTANVSNRGVNPTVGILTLTADTHTVVGGTAPSVETSVRQYLFNFVR